MWLPGIWRFALVGRPATLGQATEDSSPGPHFLGLTFPTLVGLAIRRECLDHLIVLNEAHLQRILAEYFEYYHQARVHLSLDRNAPNPRAVEPPSQGRVVSLPMVGGLHHRYKRAA